MPELPEVETIKRDLEDKVVNQKIKKIWIEKSFYKKLSPDYGEFLSFLLKKKIRGINRRAKQLIFTIDDDLYLIIHLKMTGQLVFQGEKGRLVSGGHPIQNVEKLPNKFTRVIIAFEKGGKLYFNDVRKFGYLKLVNKIELDEISEKLGLEPLKKSFTLEKFLAALKLKGNWKVKQLLLDQQIISGLGNIYADEACFETKIKPFRRIKTLTRKEKLNLYENIKKVLRKGIKYRGTSINTYVDVEGKSGRFQEIMKIYGKYGQPCSVCGTEIKKDKVAGRTSSYCPKCQR